MSTFLQLCVDVRRECHIAGTGPTAVAGQTGELERVVEWTAQSYTEIQGRHQNWRWLRSTWSVNTVAGDDTYAGTDCTDTRLVAGISRFSRWWAVDEAGYCNVKSYLSSGGVGGEGYLIWLPWNYFRDLYKKGTQNNGQPIHCTIDPQNNLVLGPKPDAVYVISGEYQMSAQVLAADADTPEMPSQYHQLIVYDAMRKHAGFKSAPDVMARAVSEGNRVLRQLELDQLPNVQLAPPMA